MCSYTLPLTKSVIDNRNASSAPPIFVGHVYLERQWTSVPDRTSSGKQCPSASHVPGLIMATSPRAGVVGGALRGQRSTFEAGASPTARPFGRPKYLEVIAVAIPREKANCKFYALRQELRSTWCKSSQVNKTMRNQSQNMVTCQK